jgi:hypothetical protein
MTKIVINTCYGGFNLSDDAMLRYADLKGILVYPRKDRWGSTTYFTSPEQDGDDLYHDDIERDDPCLVQTVEELGEEASGSCSRLVVVEIPDDVQWMIEEYDGSEWVAEVHRVWG